MYNDDNGMNMVGMDMGGGGGGGGMQQMSAAAAGGSSNQPQWGYHETKEFISIRGVLEKDFVQNKGNSKQMWDVISAQMKERGYRRTPAQCKQKWRALVNRYKEKDSAAAAGQPVPFYEELDAIFKERARNMDRLLMQAETGTSVPEFETPGADIGTLQLVKPSKRGRARSDDENSEEEEGDDVAGEDLEDDMPSKKRKQVGGGRAIVERQRAGTIQEVLEQFFLQQLRLEQEWREAIERREADRRQREKEWRDRMEALEKERMAREAAWRQLEEQRRQREEERAERRDQLIAALLAKLG